MILIPRVVHKVDIRVSPSREDGIVTRIVRESGRGMMLESREDAKDQWDRESRGIFLFPFPLELSPGRR